MKQFLKKVSFFFIIVSSISLVAEHIITQGLKSTPVSLFGSWNDLFDGAIQAEVIISGSSKAYSNVYPLVLDSVISSNSYNLGISGNDFLSQYYKYQAYLNHNKAPNLLIQIVGSHCLKKNAGLHDIKQFLPYIEHPPIQKLLQQYSQLDIFDYHLPFKRYFGEKKAIHEGFLNYFHLADTLTNNLYKGGFLADEPWDNSFERFIKYTPNGKAMAQDKDLCQLFEQFLIEQKQSNVNTILVYAPTYQPSHAYITNRKEIIKYYTTIAAKHQIPFIDYSDLPLTKNKALFFNSQHLNAEGAILFSRILGEDIKQYL